MDRPHIDQGSSDVMVAESVEGRRFTQTNQVPQNSHDGINCEEKVPNREDWSSCGNSISGKKCE